MADEIISLREFAKRKSVSLTAVQKACKPEVGRIVPERDETGKITGINWTTQADPWEANRRKDSVPKSPAGGRPRKDGLATASATKAPLDAAGPPLDHGGQKPMSITDIQRARELVKLQLDNIKLKEAQGELVSAERQKAQGATLGALVSAALYNIPERISDDLAGMTKPHDIHKLLTAEIDMAVEQLRKLVNAA